MANYTFDKIEYGGNVYIVQDSGALQLTGGQVTGPVTFGDAITIDEATIGDLVVNGSASFTNNIQANTINGVAVGSSPKFTDTNTEVSTLTLASGSTAGTSLAYGGKYTLTAGSKTVSFTMPASDNTNTTYTLSNALSSHKFTSTLTAGGSGSGTSTATMEFVAGTGITLTDDTTNKKITIASSIVNTDQKLITEEATTATGYLIFGGSSSAAETKKYSYSYKVGVDASDEEATLTIGRSGLIEGGLGLCSSNYSGITHLWANSTGSGAHIYLPSSGGTLALISDIPTKTSTTATLSTTWTSNQQTVTVSGVTASNTVIVTPAPASYNDYCEAGIYCSAQAANSLTFKCEDAPSSALTVNILILN